MISEEYVNQHSKEFKLEAYVKSSSYRVKVINYLTKNGIGTPTEIARECHIRVNHISRVLKELKNKDLIVCINEDSRKGRLYKLTSNSYEMLRVLDKGGRSL